MVLPEISLSDAYASALRLKTRIEEHDFRRVGTLTASLGVTSSCPGDTLESLIKRADEALYGAKADGRNRVESRAC